MVIAFILLLISGASAEFVQSNVSDSHLSIIHSVKKLSVDDYAAILRRRLDYLKTGESKEVELIVLIDGSSSVGDANFQNEVKFVRKLVADFVVGPKHVKIAVVVFHTEIITYVNHLNGSEAWEKCSLLHRQLPRIIYSGGNTFTLGALQEAALILAQARPKAKKVVFLITDGFSNNGDPVPVAQEIKQSGTKIFSFGIKTGNIAELIRISSPPSEEHAYFLESFSEFEALARRALHADLGTGIYQAVSDSNLCSGLCSNSSEGGSCCNANATCACGSHSGHFSCLCPPGHYGSGLFSEDCLPCPAGTYNEGAVPGDLTVCLPCPDRSLNTKKYPATSILDCMCSDGFTPVEGACRVVTCPLLNPPKNGYFVKENCSNVLHAACGVRCEIGYELLGASVRLCQLNGTWAGEQPLCRPKACKQLKPFDFGQMHCVNEDEGFEVLVDYGEGVVKREIVKKKKNLGEIAEPWGTLDGGGFVVDTECRFSCPIGFSLIGSKLRTCLPITRWDGLQATCKRIVCGSLPRLAFGEMRPSNCSSPGVRHSYGSTCLVTCQRGFLLKGNSTRLCTGKHGTWTGKGQVYKCVDSEPPQFNCSEDVTFPTDKGSSVASVTFALPNATDNSGVAPVLWMEPPLSEETVTELPIGKHLVIVHGKDAAGNAARCSFSIIIQDKESPTVENCASPPAMNLSDLIKLDSAAEPVFSDNSGNVSVSATHVIDSKTGNISFNYTATDPSGNTAGCVINVTITGITCSKPPTRDNQEAFCSSDEVSTRCNISCKAGYTSSAENVTLTCADGRWQLNNSIYNAFNAEFYCSEIVPPKDVEVKVEMSVASEVCAQGLDELENEISQLLSDVVTTIECIHDDENATETNLISRRRRSAKPRTHSKISFVFKSKQIIENKQLYFYNTTEKASDRLRHILTSSPLGINGRRLLIENVSAYERVISCHPGSVLIGNLCSKCAAGQEFNASSGSCEPCAVGFFQHEEGSMRCLQCPSHTTTLGAGARALAYCKKICMKGSFSPRSTLTGVAIEPCRPCPRGQYQPNEGQKVCLSCWSRLANITDECRAIVRPCSINTCRNNGTCSGIHAAPCVCPDGYLGAFCEKRFKPCDSSPCLHGGTCMEVSSIQFSCVCPRGFHGATCHLETDFCASLPCQNDAVCTSTDEGFYCDCANSFQGPTCNEVAETCTLLEPCQNNGSCTMSNGDFTCNCSSEFFGRFCEKVRNFAPEREAALDMELSCPHSFEIRGGKCLQSKNDRQEINELAVLAFRKGSPASYLMTDIHHAHIVLTEVTFCLWIQTSDDFNYGTLYSYATRAHDNEFTVTDYSGLVLYVGGDRVVTDVVINDGLWHLICVSWQSQRGVWKVFVDGKTTSSGESLAPDYAIQTGGTLVIGQEQDFVGGGFNEVESFIGKMAGFKMWDRILGDDEIAEMTDTCAERLHTRRGSAPLWSSLLLSPRGNIQVENSTFCKSCGDAPEMFRAEVKTDSSGQSAEYQCHPGFTIKFPDFPELNSFTPVTSWTRKCLVTGEWQPNLPICARLSCGSPGWVANGSVVGRSYLYEDIIRYLCHEGYQLEGSRRRSCLANATWSGTKPTCREMTRIGECASLTAPRRGALFLLSHRPGLDTSLMPGDRAEFTCDVGYRLEGVATIVCMPGGVWSSSPPICSPCSPLLDPC